MKLTRIRKIRAHRMFRDFVWPSELHSFGRFNLIYGWNACGKTTLSALLAYVQKRVALSEGELELEFDSASKVTGAELASALVPEVRVFNRDFVSRTLQAGGSDIAPIYYLGEDSIEKQARVKALKENLAAANAEVTSSKSRQLAAEAEFEEFCVSRARLIKELLISANSTGYNNFDKRSFKRAMEGLSTADVTAAFLTDEEKARLRSQKDARPKEAIEKVAVPTSSLAALAKEVDAMVGSSVVAQTLDELAADTELASWVQRGLALHSGERDSSTCRFCLQPFQASRRSALEAHFNDAFANFQRELEALLARLNVARQLLVTMQLPDASRFYDHLAASASAAIESIRTLASNAESAIDALISRIEAKRSNPFGPALSSAPAAAAPLSLVETIAALNNAIDKHNKTTQDFPRSVKVACDELEHHYVAEALARFAQLSEAASAASLDLAKAKRTPVSIQAEIDALEREILEHRRPADELTEELRAYLGHAELRFEAQDTGYALTRAGQPVSNLSEGERTAITFLYFLKSLQDRAFDMPNGIVVIDDPVSSLDANALFSAFGYMKQRTRECGQLFVFTHSFPFFRLVKNWYSRGINRDKKKDQRPAKFFQLCARGHSDGSRTSQLGRLDRLLEEYESEYQYLFKRIYDEAQRSDADSLEHHYGLPNVARRLLEAFLAFRFPDLRGDSDLSPRLDRVNFDSARKTRILRLLNTYSHAGAIGAPEHDLSLLAETRPVLLDVLELMKAVDRDHYDGLEKLVATAEGAP